MNRITALLAVVGLAVACAGADADDLPAGPGTPTSSAACLEGTTDCADTVVEPDGGPESSLDEGALIRDAEALLGETESVALASGSDVRLGRRGDETMALTEDYVIGRRTIATEDDGSGTFRVVEIALELTEGVHQITAD